MNRIRYNFKIIVSNSAVTNWLENSNNIHDSIAPILPAGFELQGIKIAELTSAAYEIDIVGWFPIERQEPFDFNPLIDFINSIKDTPPVVDAEQ